MSIRDIFYLNLFTAIAIMLIIITTYGFTMSEIHKLQEQVEQCAAKSIEPPIGSDLLESSTRLEERDCYREPGSMIVTCYD